MVVMLAGELGVLGVWTCAECGKGTGNKPKNEDGLTWCDNCVYMEQREEAQEKYLVSIGEEGD
jgi:hypothetical protein